MSKSLGRRIGGIILPLLILCVFTGCPTPPKPSPRVTPLGQAQAAPSPTEEDPALAPEVIAEEAPPSGVVEKPESILPEETLNLPWGYLPVNMWAGQCGFEKGRMNKNGVFELQAGDKLLELMAKQRFARWNGIHLALGFPPQPGTNEVLIHSLDISKNIHPLLHGYLRFPGERVLVLDPGHGGRDSGTRTSSGAVLEKDLALDWALRVERLLEGSNWKVILTRRDDRELPLLERVAMADAAGAALFVSLHFNSSGSSAARATESGIETFCLTPTGMGSTLTRGYADDVTKRFPNNEFDVENLVLAMRMQSTMTRATGQKDRGVRRARFMTVLREQRRPAVLLEGGFLSHPAESKLIVQEEHRQKLAQAVVDGLPRWEE